jgi:hypothetical protein
MKCGREEMMPPSEEARTRLLGRVQELHAEILRVRDRVHARHLKRAVLELHEAAHADGGATDLPVILDAFVHETRETLISFLGTAAWDDPDTGEEARAAMRGWMPMRPASVAPGEIIQRLYDSEINACISWVYGGGFEWSLGDGIIVRRSEGTAKRLDDAAAAVADAAAVAYPDSDFAVWWIGPHRRRA